MPRIINVIADRALLGAYTREEPIVNGALVRRAASEVYGRPVLAPWIRWLAIGGAVAGVALLGFVLWRAWPALDRAERGRGRRRNERRAAARRRAAAAARAARRRAREGCRGDDDGCRLRLAVLAVGRRVPAGRRRRLRPGASRTGLSCVWQRGSLAQLKLINRPAILSLVDAEGAAHQVVLSELGDDGAKLLVGGGETRVPVAELADYWFGEFLVLWRPQSSGPAAAARRHARRRRALAAPGARAALGPARPAADGDYFDAELQQLVENFQRSRRLAVDGVAGLQTQLVLDAALGAPGTPTLAHAGAQAGA